MSDSLEEEGDRSCIIQSAEAMIGVSRSNRVEDLDMITEGRYTYRHPKYGWYAWCGDFASWLLEHCGCKDPTAINRVSVAGKWTPGDNIARIMRWSKAHGASFTDPSQLKRGDYYVKPAPSGDHIGVVHVVRANSYTTIDGNGWKGAVSQGERSFDAAIRTFIRTPAFLGDGVIFAPAHQAGVTPPEYWPSGVILGLPVLPGLDIPNNDPETQADDAPEFGVLDNNKETCK